LTGGVTNNSANVQTLSVPVVLSGTQTFNAASNSIVLNTNVSGTGGLVFAGTNRLTLAGSNTYSGPTTISAGALTISGLGQLGGGAYGQPIADNGALNYNSAAAQTLSGVISGSGALTQNGPGTLALTAANTYTNTTTINGGFVAVQNSTSLGAGNVMINGGGIILSSNGFTGYTLANSFFFTNTSIIDMNHSTNSHVLSGALSGHGTVIISNMDWSASGETNQATLTFGAASASSTMNAFSGRIVIQGMNSDGLASIGTLRFNNGTTSYNTGSSNASFDLGTGAVALMSRNGGTINLGELKGGPATVLLGSRGGGGTTYWSVGGLNTTTTFAGSISNFGAGFVSALTKVGTGTLILTGTNTDAGDPVNGPTGPIMINAGTLQIGDGGADGTLTSGNVTNNAALVFDRSDSYTVPNVISGTGSVTNLGTGTLIVSTVGGANTYSGGTTISAGTVVVAAGTTSGTGAGAVTVNSGGTLLVNGAIGAGAVTVNSGGTLGGSGGTIGGTVTSQSGGVIQPGAGVSTAGAVLTTGGAVIMNSGSTTILRVSHNNHTNDQIACTAITYSGTLTVTTNAGDGPLVAGDTFQLFKAISSSFYVGSFSATNLPALSPGLGWTNTLGVDGSIEVIGSPVSSAPVAGFSGTPTNIFVTQTVTFTDASTGSITNWVWNYGDGNSVTNSSNASVQHAYAAAGSYTVSLTVNGVDGTSTSTRTSYVVVKPKAALGGVTLAGGKLVFSGTNGPAGQQYRILTTTNVALPRASWMPVWTNVFAADGSYSYTNTPEAGASSFFLLVSP